MPHPAHPVLAHDRSGPEEGASLVLVLVHAGIADRRMWDDVLPRLTTSYDVVRVDLRGFGESATPPAGSWSHSSDLAATLDDLGVPRAHLVGCSLGAGVCAELAVVRPDLAESLVLVAPGGGLITEVTDELRAFGRAENAALEAEDLDAATEANLRHWVDGPRRAEGTAAADVRERVRVMQRQAFELTRAWPDSVWDAEEELDPPVADRLHELVAPTLVLWGDEDLDTVGLAGRRVVELAAGARSVTWPDVAHLPPVERPDDFVRLLSAWVDGRP